MNYTLAELQKRVARLVKDLGEDAHCAAWIYTAEDCQLWDNDRDPSYPCEDNPELAERVFNDVGNIDYIYQVIQECVDECTEQQYNKLQKELN